MRGGNEQTCPTSGAAASRKDGHDRRDGQRKRPRATMGLLPYADRIARGGAIGQQQPFRRASGGGPVGECAFQQSMGLGLKTAPS